MLWALQKEAIKKGSFATETGNKSGLMRNVILGVVGFALFVVLGLATHKTYKKFIPRQATEIHHGTPRRPEREEDYYSDDGSAYSQDFVTSFSKGTNSGDDQSYQYSLEDGIVSPKSNKTNKSKSSLIKSLSPRKVFRLSRKVPEQSQADLAAYLAECDDEHGTDAFNGVDQVAKTVCSFMDMPPKRVRRDVYAPAGKLGIIVDTSSDGPIVHSLNADSPLVGKVFIGDYIVAVDDEDTSDWSAHYVTKLVARKSGSVRKLTLLSIENRIE